MSWLRRATIGAIAPATLLAVGCGSSSPGSQHNTEGAIAAVQIPLDTSVASAGGSWATIVMGGSAAQRNNFWQVFERSPSGARWTLVTPPGTADNGGLVVVPGGGQSAFTAFRPSNLLTFTPLSRTTDGGQSWSAVNPLDAVLASSPGALAVQPITGQLLGLTAQGAVEQASAGGSWRVVTTIRALAASAAARECGLTKVTAVAYSPAGDILVAGACSKAGVAGLFTDAAGNWHSAGLALSASLSGDDITVLRLVLTGPDVTALLQAGTGQTGSLVAASSGSGSRWSLSQPLPLRGAALASAAFGQAGTVAVTTTAGSGDLIDSGASTWQSLPRPPTGTAALASLDGSGIDALAVDRSTLTVWHLTRPAGEWQRVQSMTVPIQYGSSG